MTAFGAILDYGVHIPRLRLPRALLQTAMGWANPPARGPARGARAICNWDEDALTLAVEAARGCVQPPPRSLVFCSTTAPFADRDDAVMLAAALALPESSETMNLSASLRAGSNGLMNAVRRPDVDTLLVASESRLTRPGSPQESTYGDAAVALRIGQPTNTACATVLAVHGIASDFVDHYRMHGADFDYALEERWLRDEFLLKLVPRVVAQVLASAGVAAESIRHVVLPAGAATGKRVAQACGVEGARRDERLMAECGDAGAAMPLLLLAEALDEARPQELILLLGVGQGVDVMLLRAEDGLLARRGRVARALEAKRDETSYVRYLSHRGLLDVDFGMRAERDQRTAHSVAFRKLESISAFMGGRCERCGSVQFPRSRVCVDPQCRATDTQTPYRLADSAGRVKSFTEDWQAYAARPPYCYGNVEFGEGGNLLMEFTDVEPGELKVNDPVRFVYRIKDQDRARGFRRYFWKAIRTVGNG